MKQEKLLIKLILVNKKSKKGCPTTILIVIRRPFLREIIEIFTTLYYITAYLVRISSEFININI